MNTRRLRLRLAVLFGLVAAALAIGPLLLWHSGRAEAIRDDFDDGLTEQMDILQREVIADGEPGDIWFPAWFVQREDEWIDPITDEFSELQPPLLLWAQETGDWPSFRNYSQDEASFRGYISPIGDEQVLVTLGSADALDQELADLNRRTTLWAIALGLVAIGLGWASASLALAPTRRMLSDQQGFLADAAHEMRTPLAVITASSSQALARPRSSEEYVRSLSEIRSAAERASTGVNELLDLVRFDTGQAIPRIAPLRLDLLAEEVAASTIVPAGEGVDPVDVVARPGEPVVVDADMALVRQAIDNVVRNAVRRSTRVELTSRLDDRMGVVTVADDGPGFSPEVLPKVFDRYQRGDQRGEVGVGLAIVKAIVEANGGTVAAANAEGGGAEVTISLPLTSR